MDLQQLEREWVNTSAESGALQAKIWDAKAAEWKEKPIPNMETDVFLQAVQKKIKLQPFMRTLDIGCGAGRYTMAIAPLVKQAVGTDVSPEMIRMAEERAGRLGFENTEFWRQEWENTDLDAAGWRGSFDLVFAYMTPAVNDFQTLDKMNACSRGYCFLVKPARRMDAVQDAAFARVGITKHHQRMDDAVPNTFAYLWMKGYCPEISYRNEIWESEQNLSEITDWCINRAELQKKLSEQEKEMIRSYLKEISTDGTVKETVTTTIVTICWKV